MTAVEEVLRDRRVAQWVARMAPRILVRDLDEAACAELRRLLIDAELTHDGMSEPAAGRLDDASLRSFAVALADHMLTAGMDAVTAADGREQPDDIVTFQWSSSCGLPAKWVGLVEPHRMGVLLDALKPFEGVLSLDLVDESGDPR